MFRKLFHSKGAIVLSAAIVIGLLASSVSFATGEGRTLLLGKRNPGSNASAALSSETQIIANNGTYGTRQSNKSDNGGGAIYGCRSSARRLREGQRALRPRLEPGRRPRVRVLGQRRHRGRRITSGNTNAAPFITNATGVATGLNADQVDGKGADDIARAAHDDAATTATAAVQGATSIAAVSDAGALGAVKRGFASSTTTGTGTYQVVASNDISACAIQVTEATVTSAGAAAAAAGGRQEDDQRLHPRRRGRPGQQGVPRHGELLAAALRVQVPRTRVAHACEDAPAPAACPSPPGRRTGGRADRCRSTPARAWKGRGGERP